MKVRLQYEKSYPGKSIFENSVDGVVSEMICEVEPTTDHASWSLAIAVIDKSEKHHHKKTTETYKVVKGQLKLYVDNEVIELSEGDTHTIQPGQVHWAEGDETWVECRSEPGWRIEDHMSD